MYALYMITTFPMTMTFDGRITYLLPSLLLLLLASCKPSPYTDQADCFNDRSYSLRYSDIDSSLHYARRALAISKGESDSKAEAWNNIAYVAYQQMRYDEAMHVLRHIYEGSHNQIELLCADVMTMKVAQRIGDGKLFFDKRIQALRRIKRIQDSIHELDARQLKRFHYGCSELHIVSSTYYYYLGLDASAIHEIQAASPYVSLERDTLQWLYYSYMLGSGGLIEGDWEKVTIQEFDILVQAFSVSRRHGITYFEANTLQSLAVCICDSAKAALIREHLPYAYSYVVAQAAGADVPYGLDSLHSVSYALADKSARLFSRYKDLYQTACAERTLGEILFSARLYGESLRQLLHAQHLARSQRKRGGRTVASWMISIHEKLSMAYAALDMKEESDHHRNLYLDLLDDTRQNKEMDSRKEELTRELHSIYVKLLILAMLIVCLTILVVVYTLRVRRHTRSYYSDILNMRHSPAFTKAMEAVSSLGKHLKDEEEIVQDECNMAGMKTLESKKGNIERRAKVAMAYSIVPYLDRIIAEVNRMVADGKASKDRLQYVSELLDEIMHVNHSLTDWIQISKGDLKLHITVFPLESLFAIIRLSSHSFGQKGIRLTVQPTDLMVRADKALTLFSINTLADNARKFTPEGGEVTISCSATDQYVEISIVDTGIGLSAEDVQTLNQSKVYDSTQLGNGKEEKGYGFGIMNCKGIVGKYRKLSSRFHVCDIGVESQLGKGSRFWLRLPRVMASALAFFVCGLSLSARDATSYELYESAYQCNVSRQYSQAKELASRAVEAMALPPDTMLLVSLYNEIAISSLALHQWDEYARYNAECVRLHRLYSQDSSLARYCMQMEKTRSDRTIFLVMLTFLSVALAVLFYLSFLRDRLRSKTKVLALRNRLDAVSARVSSVAGDMAAPDARHYFPDMASSCNALAGWLHEEEKATLSELVRDARISASVHHYYSTLADGIAEPCRQLCKLQQLTERRDRMMLEAERLYVSNQILDNALSTLKHETMYYPARTQQVVSSLTEGDGDLARLKDLQDVLDYYRKIYMILYGQAERQMPTNAFRRELVSVVSLFDFAVSYVQSYASRHGGRPGITVGGDKPTVMGDALMLQELLRHLLSIYAGNAAHVSFRSARQGNVVRIACNFQGLDTPPPCVEEAFTHHTDHTSYLIMKQIIRELDALCGFPGLRLEACKEEGGVTVWFTLRCVDVTEQA